MKYFFTFFILFTVMHSYAQSIKQYLEDSAWISNERTHSIELNAQDDSTGNAVHVPFNGFIVEDVRFDTGFAGINIKTRASASKKYYEKLNFKKGTTASLLNYLNDPRICTFTPAGNVLYCYVKQLWITQVDTFNKETNKRELYDRLSLEIEAYMSKEDRYYAALRLDTAALSVTVHSSKLSLLADVLHVFAAKAALADTEKIFKRTGYTFADLYKRYNQRFDKPILNAKQLQAGVYANFNEFINNNPSVKQYELKKGILYTRTAGYDWLPERNAFGFCDGKILWINADHNYHPLIKRGHTFEFLKEYYSSEYLKIIEPLNVGNSNPAAGFGQSVLTTGLIYSILANNDNGKIAYQLNMEKGGIY